MTITAGRDISKGEHFSIMYSHALWGTQARRAHLFETKKFWCFCPRCKDATEFGKQFPLKRFQLPQFSTNMVFANIVWNQEILVFLSKVQVCHWIC